MKSIEDMRKELEIQKASIDTHYISISKRLDVLKDGIEELIRTNTDAKSDAKAITTFSSIIGSDEKKVVSGQVETKAPEQAEALTDDRECITPAKKS